MVKVISELYSQKCRNIIESFQELKQLICTWPFSNFNDQLFLERRVWMCSVAK